MQDRFQNQGKVYAHNVMQGIFVNLVQLSNNHVLRALIVPQELEFVRRVMRDTTAQCDQEQQRYVRQGRTRKPDNQHVRFVRVVVTVKRVQQNQPHVLVELIVVQGKAPVLCAMKVTSAPMEQHILFYAWEALGVQMLPVRVEHASLVIIVR